MSIHDLEYTHGPLSSADVEALESRLKPCPFCGGAGRLGNTWTAYYSVQCKRESCEAEIHGIAAEDSTSRRHDDHLFSARHAVRRWNRRLKT